jgi:outer membrane immunogenic protein
MRKLLFSGVAFAALVAGPAMAADQAAPVYKRPRPVVLAAPVYKWTGFYVGGNVGYSWGDPRTDIAGNGNLNTVVQTAATTFFGIAGSNTTRLDGVIGGGQIGYNYQFSPNTVLGFEADIQGSGERGSSQSTDPFIVPICFASVGGVCTNPQPPSSGTALTSYQAKIDWFGTVRGRLGILLGDQFLIYGTGGLAYGRVAISGNPSVNIAVGSMTANSAFASSNTNAGFTVGAGAEGRFSYWLPPNWTWRVEYLYLDLGSLNTTSSFATSSSVAAFTSTAGSLTTHTHFTDNIVRVGLNYKFGNYYAPVVAK